jgi:trehalose/maltose hydrolase-like predicted phosphorylase
MSVLAPEDPTRLAGALLPACQTTDPSWLLVEEGVNLVREHEIESLLTVSNGYVGTRGSLAEGTAFSSPMTFIAGVFGLRDAPDGVPELVPAPDWTALRITACGRTLRLEEPGTLEQRRILDLRQGLLWREWRHRDPAGRVTRLRFLRLASLADRHVLLQVLTLTAENYAGQVLLEGWFPSSGLDVRVRPPPPEAVAGASPRPTPASAEARPTASPAALVLEYRAPGTGTTVALAAASRPAGDQPSADRPQDDAGQGPAPLQRWHLDVGIGRTFRLDRFACVSTSRDVARPAEAALQHLERLLGRNNGAHDVITAHTRAWAERWAAADVQVEGDPEAQRALRFAVYHLVGASNPDDGRVSVGARALTGDGYKGHVFWDTEIYLLPFYIFTHPPAARALLLYRYHTLPAARAKARALGYRGALYAWESADDGRETTPPWVVAPDGKVVRILCGEQEQHISADVAYAVWQYWQATGDDAFFRDAGAEILVETARFWASRVEPGPDGRGHIGRVIGPDEYHEGVDDDAFTNGMARWNLERGAEAVRLLQERWPDEGREVVGRLRLAPEEPGQWQATARNLYTGFDPATGLFEQFRGYFGLEAIDLAAYEPRAAPLDVLLGRERTQRTQGIKQADVVVLLALLWEHFPPAVRAANFRYYEPRTAHGSSLSPAIHALVAARLRDVPRAERYFRQAAAIDLADNLGNASGGVHIGSLGGLWQAAVLGFAGLTLRPDGLAFAPCLPESWQRLRFPVLWRGRQLQVALTRDPLACEVRLEGGHGMTVAVGEGPAAPIRPGHCYEVHGLNNRWGPWQEIG